MSTTKYIVDNQSEQTINNEPILRPYKVFTALLTQNGTSSSVSLQNDPLTIGVTYEIEDNGGPGWDFTNVGAPDNEIGTKFIATGTNPISWSGARLLSIEGAPTAIILENNIGNIWFTYSQTGLYRLNSENAFPVDKTVFQNTLTSNEDGTGLKMITITQFDSTSFYIGSVNFPDTLTDGLLNNTPIEIRVYNTPVLPS